MILGKAKYPLSKVPLWFLQRILADLDEMTFPVVMLSGDELEVWEYYYPDFEYRHCDVVYNLRELTVNRLK